VRFGDVEVGPIDNLANGENTIPQLNRYELNRSTRAARFLEPTLTLGIRRIAVLQRQTVSERKLTTKRIRRLCCPALSPPAVDLPAPFETHQLPTDSSDEAKEMRVYPSDLDCFVQRTISIKDWPVLNDIWRLTLVRYLWRIRAPPCPREGLCPPENVRPLFSMNSFLPERADTGHAG
jgi:hypothetical protein